MNHFITKIDNKININNYIETIDKLQEYLSISNRKLKNIKQDIKKVRIERNSYKNKLEEIESVLNNITYCYDRYDIPNDEDYGRVSGKIELKEELLKIIKG